MNDSDIGQLESARARMEEAVAGRRVRDALGDDEDRSNLYTAARGVDGNIEAFWLQCRPYKVNGATEAVEHSDSSFWTPHPPFWKLLAQGM